MKIEEEKIEITQKISSNVERNNQQLKFKSRKPMKNVTLSDNVIQSKLSLNPSEKAVKIINPFSV